MRHTYADQREKRIDFWVAFGLWFVVNIAAVLLVQAVSSSSSAALVLAALLILANIAAPIALAFTRGYAALGILVAFATLFALTVVEGVFFTLGDFAGGLSNASISTGFLIVGFVPFAVGAFFALRAIHRGLK